MKKILRFNSPNAEATYDLAFHMAAQWEPGEVVALRGPLGAGKTVFVQGAARGMGYAGDVLSPTYTLLHVYEGGRLNIYHFDLYRLENPELDLDGIGFDEYIHARGVCFIEWADRAAFLLPAHTIWVQLQPGSTSDTREIFISPFIQKEITR
jgi:tRNA threonylcarbamoyladenosine biosynthesis protein TsaE